jgi:hypothetical protein
VHKKGDKSDISNWRPVTLSNTIAKFYASLLVDRSDGGPSATNNSAPIRTYFALQSTIVDARRSKRQCSVAWLDRTDAFGSVPHETIFTSLQWAAVDEDAINVIRRLYATNTATTRSHQGFTSEIAIGAGVKQGCPLSPIIFNMAMEQMIRAITQLGHGYKLRDSANDVLAYADDLAIVSGTPDGLQAMLDTTGKIGTWAGLRFNHRKCAPLHIDGRKREVLPTQFHIQEGVPATLSEIQVYEQLCVPTGYHVA